MMSPSYHKQCMHWGASYVISGTELYRVDSCRRMQSFWMEGGAWHLSMGQGREFTWKKKGWGSKGFFKKWKNVRPKKNFNVVHMW